MAGTRGHWVRLADGTIVRKNRTQVVRAARRPVLGAVVSHAKANLKADRLRKRIDEGATFHELLYEFTTSRTGRSLTVQERHRRGALRRFARAHDITLPEE